MQVNEKSSSDKKASSGIPIPLLVYILVIFVALTRLLYCLLNPIYTEDLTRNLFYGLFVLKFGLKAAALPLASLDPSLSELSWALRPYSYPAMALLFFTSIAAIWPALFFAKLTLTIIEAINSYLIYRITGDKTISLLYWAYPASIIWVSQEGQFEPLQSLFTLLALYLLYRKNIYSWLFLGIAIQVKLSALLLLPYFIFYSFSEKQVKGKNLIVFALAFIPTFISNLFYPAIKQTLGASSLLYNPYYWNFKSQTIFTYNHPVYGLFNQLSTYVLLIILLYGAIKWKSAMEYLAPLLFIVLCKSHTNVMFWYMTLMPVFFIPIKDGKVRRLLIFMCLFLDIAAIVEIFLRFGGAGILARFMDVSILDRVKVFKDYLQH